MATCGAGIVGRPDRLPPRLQKDLYNLPETIGQHTHSQTARIYSSVRIFLKRLENLGISEIFLQPL
jgi:hypothetical protein